MVDADDELQRALAMSMQDHGPSEQPLGDSQEVSYPAYCLTVPPECVLLAVPSQAQIHFRALHADSKC